MWILQIGRTNHIRESQVFISRSRRHKQQMVGKEKEHKLSLHYPLDPARARLPLMLQQNTSRSFPSPTPPLDPSNHLPPQPSLPAHCCPSPNFSGGLLFKGRPCLPDDQVSCLGTFSTLSVPQTQFSESPLALDHLLALAFPSLQQAFPVSSRAGQGNRQHTVNTHS